MQHTDEFEVRLARVRHRFAVSLSSKIKDAVIAVADMRGDGDKAAHHVAESYRHLHEICGIGPTVGFSATGHAAQAAEAALTAARDQNRGLHASEALQLCDALEQLQGAATTELEAMYQRGG
ncbi:hypothetical protein BH11PSE4_BH11PSE4_02630 [soil metagenome]